MKWLSLFIALLCLVVCRNVQAQIDVKTDPRIAPLLRQAANGQLDLAIFGRKPASNMYVNMAVLDKTKQRLYWFTCYGTAYDSVQLQETAFAQVSSNAIDPFSFYRELCLKNEVCLDDAVTEYRRLGKLALKDTSYNRRIVYNSSTVKAANSTLQQLMALEGLFKKQCIKLCLFNCQSPSSLSSDERFLFRKSLAGKTVSKPDTTVYYATSPLGFVAKISLCRLDSLKMFVYDGQDKVVDSMPLRPGKYASLLRSKNDVFLLYRGWLELQSQQIKEAISQTTALLDRQDKGLYIQAYRSDNKKELLLAVAQFKIQQQDIERRILALTLPDEGMVGHMLQSNYSSGGMQIAYLGSGMGFAYTASNSRGEKEYELTNHLGNVMTTVSDRKLGIDGGNGTVAYYNVDVVNSNDYYPFGSWMPGRSYSKSEKYRYGFNGKENDNEVKGGGEQQDYGMRVYDPRLGRFLSVDPLTPQYPELSSYQFASNRPVQGIDLDGLEIYFNNSGDSVKSGSDVSKTAPVILLSNDKEISTGLTSEQFKNRVYWLSGEGAGKTSAVYYAHTIKNAKAYGYHGAGFSEDKLYSVLWRDNKYTSKDFLAGLPAEQGTNNYMSYRDAYKKVWSFSAWDAAMKMRGAAILNAEAGLSSDPTRGSTNWSGGKGAQKLNEKLYGVNNVITVSEGPFIHSYFNANTRILTPVPSEPVNVPENVKSPDDTFKNDNLWKALEKLASQKNAR